MKNKDFLITTTPTFEGVQIDTYLGVVYANVVIGVNFFSDLAASITDIFGGNSGTYQRKMDEMYESAKKNLMLKVQKIGGNAIVGFHVDFDEISGKGKGMFMLSAQGTACVVNTKETDVHNEFKASIIDSYLLEKQIKKVELSEALSKTSYSLAEESWNYILENPSSEIAKTIVDKHYFQYSESLRQKVEILISQLDYEDAVSIVYPNYIQYREETFSNENGVTVTSEVSDKYLSIIKKCKLFAPPQVLLLMDSDMSKAIPLLSCEKESYQIEDLNVMKQICEKLNNLPDVGQRTRGKINIFSKEKDIWICKKGHKNEMVDEFCLDCFTNIKGFTSEQQRIINRFKLKTKTLETLLA